ncbi:MAG: CIA30 family protein [Myxococcota bacterium]|nr:CIA30 family protein [Myxococcota bacterium]
MTGILHRPKYGTVLAMALLGVCGGGMVAIAQTQPEIRALDWTVVNDTVMGGRSSARIGWTAEKTLEWTGTLSLENNGGFVSIRARDAWFDWSKYDGVEVILVGAGRDVQVSLQRADMVIRAGGYRALVPTSKTGDTRVFIPFSAFELKRFGRRIQGPALELGLGRVGRLGLLIADKRAGAFRVELKAVRAMKTHGGRATSTEIAQAIVAAIERGVPQFNAGDAAGCASTYRSALLKLIDGGKLVPDTWAHRIALRAIEQVGTASDASAAWTLRYALDDIYRSVSK